MLNNSFRTVARSAISYQTRRMSEYSKTFVTADKKYNFRKAWLSDPSTYPLLACLGGAACFVGGVGAYYLTAGPGVHINPTQRKKLIK